MATSLAAIRAKLQAQEPRSNGKSTGTGDSTVYAHWNIPEGTSARIRFLPDADTKNTFFWVEKAMINLEFAGIKNQPESKKTTVQVPCVEMWGEACPILAEVRPWFKDASLEELGRKYWKKRSYIFQGFVHENPMADDQTPTNPIRRFNISPQIFNLVKGALLDPELENLPTDYAGGLDFTVSKTTKGGYADYSTSKWARKETSLTIEEAEAIETHGLFNLADFLPKRPGAVELQIIKEMFEASVDGQPYDADRWAAYYKPYGLQVATPATTSTTPVAETADRAVQTESVTTTPVAVEQPVVTETVAEPIATPAPAGGQRAEDILAMIRNRQKTA